MTQNELSINGMTELSSDEMANIDGGIGILAGALVVGGVIVLAYGVGYVAGYIYGAVTQ